MNKLFKRAISMVVALAMVLTLAVVVTPAKANAAELSAELTAEVAVSENASVDAAKPAFEGKNMYSLYYPADGYKGYYTYLKILNIKKSAKVTEVKSSNKAIKATLDKDSQGYKRIKLTYGKQAATTTISCKVNGKKISCKFSVFKYTNPFKSFKLGKTELAKNLNAKEIARLPKDKKKATLKVTTNKNWIIFGYVVYRNGKREAVAVKNKTTITVKNVAFNSKSYISIYVANKKTGVNGAYTLYR